MKQLLILALLPLALAAQPAKPSAKTAPPKGRPVIITLTDGSTLKASLISIQDDVLTVSSALGTSRIELANLRRIAFDGDAKAEKTSPADAKTSAVSAAIQEIRGLAAAAEGGMAYLEYKSRVANLHAKVEDAARNLSDGPLKKALSDGLTDHRLAVQVWGMLLDLKNAPDDLTRKGRDSIQLSWKNAKEHADLAERELSKQ